MGGRRLPGLAAIVGRVTGPVHLIFYVRDQAAATAFWQAVLDRPPDLNVPGMTEFALGAQVVLGLMPEAGIRSLLGSLDPDGHVVAFATRPG